MCAAKQPIVLYDRSEAPGKPFVGTPTAPERQPVAGALSIIVPAYNEEQRLRSTVEAVLVAAAAALDRYEVIIVNDGSNDGTRVIADELAAANVSVIHHAVNRGVGAAYRSGLQAARFPFVSLVPGDNAFDPACLAAFFALVGRADIIISYRENVSARSPVRRVLSVIFSTLLRFATRLPIRDGHSLYIWPVDLARQIPVPDDYRYHMTTLAALLQKVSSYAETPVQLTPRPDASSRVLRPRVVIGSGWTMLKIMLQNRLIWRPPAPLPRAVSLGEKPP
jgi:glycosyltransferase involved in cell wall biosynthesis